MGQRDLRRLLITGAMATVGGAVRRGATKDPWLARMLARKPRMLVAVALANRMARIVWALMTKNEYYPVRRSITRKANKPCLLAFRGADQRGSEQKRPPWSRYGWQYGWQYGPE